MDRGDAAHADAAIGIRVAYGPCAGVAFESTLTAPRGATVLDALRLSGLLERHPGIDLAAQPVGVWGRRCALNQPLRDGDRIELYRPLTVDPKEARRLRQREQREGARR